MLSATAIYSCSWPAAICRKQLSLRSWADTPSPPCEKQRAQDNKQSAWSVLVHPRTLERFSSKFRSCVRLGQVEDAGVLSVLCERGMKPRHVESQREGRRRRTNQSATYELYIALCFAGVDTRRGRSMARAMILRRIVGVIWVVPSSTERRH